MTLAKGDHLVKIKDGKPVEGENYVEFEVLDASYLAATAPDGKPLQTVLLKIVK